MYLLAIRIYMYSISYFAVLRAARLLWCGEALLQWDVLFILVLGQQTNAPAIFYAASDSSVIEVFGLDDCPFCRNVYCFFSWWRHWRTVFLDFGAVFDHGVLVNMRRNFECLLWMIEMLEEYLLRDTTLTCSDFQYNWGWSFQAHNFRTEFLGIEWVCVRLFVIWIECKSRTNFSQNAVA